MLTIKGPKFIASLEGELSWSGFCWNITYGSGELLEYAYEHEYQTFMFGISELLEVPTKMTHEIREAFTHCESSFICFDEIQLHNAN